MTERLAPEALALAPVATEAPSVTQDPDWIVDQGRLADLAAALHRATRAVVRLRPDGLLEVVLAGEVIGYVDYVAPVFVALSGDRPAFAVEVAQRLSLDRAVDAVRAAREHVA